MIKTNWLRNTLIHALSVSTRKHCILQTWDKSHRHVSAYL